MGERRYPPNRLLAWERLQRGWSYEELTDRIRAEMKRCGDPDTGLTANTVRRWEIGERWPDARFRKHLVAIFGKPASELGLLTPDEMAMRPVPDVVTEIRRLLAMVEAETGPGGLDRGGFLRSLLGVGALPLLARLTGDDTVGPYLTADGRSHKSGPPQVDAFSQIVAGQRTLYWASPAAELFEAAYVNTQVGIRLLRNAVDDAIRDPIATALAECALLAGRLAFFDLQESVVAQRCYDLALSATRQCGDHALAVGVLGHMAFIPGFAGDARRARELLDVAHQHCWYGVTPLIRSWLHCVAAEAQARSSEPRGYQRRIGLAEESLEAADRLPAWFDFYDASRLEGFAGYSALAAGDRQTATLRLTNALDQLASTAGKQRTVLLADLATAADDPGRAAGLLHDAIDVLARDWYATGHQRIGMVIAGLPTGPDKTGVLDRYRALAPIALPGG